MERDMFRKTPYSIAVAGLVLSMACSNSPPPEQPAPQPSEAELATQRRVQDSLDGIRRMAVADSVERARVAELAVRAQADSVERVRLAEAAVVREASEKAAAQTAELSQELKTMVHFDVGASALQSEGRDALDRKVAILMANPAVRLQITGACDDRGSDAYNLALGTRRAVAVRKYLVGKGIDATRFDENSTGEGSPIDTGQDEMAWAKNRRAEFAIMNGDVLLAAK
jgi:peptidoglycan-associated lipoprotein